MNDTIITEDLFIGNDIKIVGRFSDNFHYINHSHSIIHIKEDALTDSFKNLCRSWRELYDKTSI